MTQPFRLRSIRAYRSASALCQLLQLICTALPRPGAMFTGFVGVFFIAGLSVPVFAQTKEQNRIENSAMVMEILNIPDNIPGGLLSKAECVMVIPSALRFAFIVGGSYDRGVITCRSGQEFDGPWSARSMKALEGASFGFQAGGRATDFVLLLMNPRAAGAILSSKVKLGVDASVAAGPLGRASEAALDVSMRAEILSYSRARGLVAGISLAGCTLRADNRANQNLYKKRLDAKAIVLKGEVAAPPAAERLLAMLKYQLAAPQKNLATYCFGAAALSSPLREGRIKRVNSLARYTKGGNHEYGRCFSSSCFGNA